MRAFITKLPDKDAEKFIEACRRVGKSYYEVLRELIYRWLEEQGVDVDDAPMDVRLSSIEQKLKKLELEHQRTREELEEIAREYQQLKKQLEELEKVNKQGLGAWVRR